MSSAESEGGSGVGTIALIVIGVVVVWVLAHGSGSQRGIFSDNTGTSTDVTGTSTNLFGIFHTPVIYSGVDTPPQDSPYYVPEETSSPQPSLSNDEIERQLYAATQDVARIKEETRIVKLWGVVSPYKDQINFSQGNAWETDPKTEYLTLSVSGSAPVDISDWRIESAVTGNRARIAFGARLPKSGRVNTPDRIVVAPNETAYIVTGESPIGVSFHENMCTGYFAQYQQFTPYLPQKCPYPLDEMKSFAHIDRDNDACYDAVQGLPSCTVVDESNLGTTISAACKNFIANDLTYSGCVKNHNTDPYFFDGSWHVYLGEDNELWRSTREDIRLLDAESRTVALLDY